MEEHCASRLFYDRILNSVMICSLSFLLQRDLSDCHEVLFFVLDPLLGKRNTCAKKLFLYTLLFIGTSQKRKRRVFLFCFLNWNARHIFSVTVSNQNLRYCSDDYLIDIVIRLLLSFHGKIRTTARAKTSTTV